MGESLQAYRLSMSRWSAERTTRLLMPPLLVAGMSCLAYADALDLLKAGLAARSRGDFAAAADFYTKAMDTGGLSSADLAAVLTSRGPAYDMIGQTDRAIDDFTAAIRLNPNHSDTYAHRGLAWAKKRDFNRAAKAELTRLQSNH